MSNFAALGESFQGTHQLLNSGLQLLFSVSRRKHMPWTAWNDSGGAAPSEVWPEVWQVDRGTCCLPRHKVRAWRVKRAQQSQHEYLTTAFSKSNLSLVRRYPLEILSMCHKGIRQEFLLLAYWVLSHECSLTTNPSWSPHLFFLTVLSSCIKQEFKAETSV